MNFAGLLHGVARRLPDKEALVDGARRFSFRDFWRRVTAAGELYRAWGVAPGERVALVLPNGAELLFFHFGALKQGIVSVPVRDEYRSGELSRILADCRPRALVASAAWLGDNAALLERPEGLRVVALEDVRDGSGGGDERARPLPSADLASINYSYFGHGRSLGAALSHGAHAYAATGYARHQGFTSRERFLIVLPMAHVYALSGCVNSGLIRGGTLVIQQRLTPRAVFQALEQERISVLSAVPAMWDYLARFPHKDRYDRRALRLCVTGGEYMDAERQARVEAAMGASLVQGYGLTECLPVICNPPRGRNRHGTLGIPGRRDIHLRILGGDGGALPPGAVGEIAIRSPTTMSAYWGCPAETAAILRDGWLRTGDEGFLDGEGYLHFTGLRKPILNLNGNKVDPREVATLLATHPAVASASVRGRVLPGPPDTLEIVAEVRLREGHAGDETDLKAFVRRRLAPYKVPACIRAVPQPHAPEHAADAATLCVAPAQPA